MFLSFVSKMLYNVKDTRVNEMRKWILLRLLRVFVINTVQGFRVLSANFLSGNGFKVFIIIIIPFARALHSLHSTFYINGSTFEKLIDDG